MDPQCFLLTTTTLHLWVLDLALYRENYGQYVSMLSGDEKTRAQSLSNLESKIRFILSRAALRQLLSGYLDLPATNLKLSYTHNGKPYLASGSPQFNLSHSQARVMYAVTLNTHVGVDIQFARPLKNCLKLCERFVPAFERVAIYDSSPSLRTQKFYETWVKLEAFSKAMGGRLLSVMRQLDEDANMKDDYERFCRSAVWLDSHYVYAWAAKGLINTAHCFQLKLRLV